MFPEGFSLLKDVCPADPHPGSSDPIDLILGIDVYIRIIKKGLRKSSNNQIIAQDTGLGWIIHGSSPGSSSNSLPPHTSLQCVVDSDLSSLLECFWKQEEVAADLSPLSADEAACDYHFASTHYRNDDGRYVLKLPMKSNLNELSNFDFAARSMFKGMEARFKDQPHFHDAYVKFMDEYGTLGHIVDGILKTTGSWHIEDHRIMAY